MFVIALGQMLLSFNFSALPVSMGGMVESFQTPPTTVATAIVLYSLGVSAFILVGAKVGQRFGSRRTFQASLVVFGIAMTAVAMSPTVEVLLAAQGVAGLACAVIVPTLVVLVAHHYHGRQQSVALGLLGAAGAGASVVAFLFGGAVATFLTWRVTFGLLIVHVICTLIMSFRLKSAKPQGGVSIDLIGSFLSVVAVFFIALGFHFLLSWGLLLASPEAPIAVVGVSPAPIMIVAGIVVGMSFFVWTNRRVERGETPLLSLEVIDSNHEWAAIAAISAIAVTEAALNFAIPLYIQIVQGRSGLETALAIMPLMLSVLVSAVLVVRLYNRYSARRIATSAFFLVFVGNAWLPTLRETIGVRRR